MKLKNTKYKLINRNCTRMRKARVFPEPVFAAPRTSRPESEWGSEARWMSLMTVYLEPNPSFIFREMGSWSNRVDPAYGEKEPSPVGPAGASGGGAGMERGLDPDSGFWDSIHESRSSISCDSGRRTCLRKTRALDFDFFMSD